MDEKDSPASTSKAASQFRSDAPLISALCPTYDRRQHIPRAIRCFLEQDYPNKELIILDDGKDAIADLVPEHPDIRYHRSVGAARMTIGPKRERLVELAQGEIMALWDDDDWHSATRLSFQAEAILSDSTKQACLFDRVMLWDERTDDTWVFAGGLVVATLMFTRAYHELGGFPSEGSTADQEFVFAKPDDLVVTLDGFGRYVAIRHAENSTSFQAIGSMFTRSPISGRVFVED